LLSPTLWIIEKKESHASLINPFLDHFAVRRFSSLEGSYPSSLPDLILINTDDYSYFPNSTSLPFGKTATFLWGKNSPSWVNKNPSLRIAKDLSQILDSIKDIHIETPNLSKIQLKNITLYLDRLYFTVCPDINEHHHLPFKEAQLLKFFMENPEVFFERLFIQKEIWGHLKVSPRTVDSHLSRLRCRLEFSEFTIQNIYGRGYRLTDSIR
jgi:hypothetical protein